MLPQKEEIIIYASMIEYQKNLKEHLVYETGEIFVTW